MTAAKYMDYVRSLPCAFCSAEPPSDPHHYGLGGMGTKCSDYRTVALCNSHHTEFHNTRKIGPFDVERTKLELLKSQVTQLVDWLETRGEDQGLSYTKRRK